MASTKAFIVGSGCIGLRTALELLRKGTKVVLRSPRSPLHQATCSQGAGGYFMPFHCGDDHERINRWCKETLDELHSKINASKETGDPEPIEILHACVFHRKNHLHPKNTLPGWTNLEKLNFQAMSLDILAWQNELHKLRIPNPVDLEKAGYLYNWLYRAPIVNPPKMLQKMYEEVLSHPLAVDIDVTTGKIYNSMDEIVKDALDNDCDAVVNCTGLGAQKLCGDDNLVAGRGILYHYDRKCQRRTPDNWVNDVVLTAEESPWGQDGYPCYLIPRGDIIVVGGSFLEGDMKDEIRANERQILERNAYTFGIDVNNVKPIGEWTGFRPYRSVVRLEIDNNYGVKEGIKVVHSYGHGGSGWTLFVGAAKEASVLLGRPD